MDRGWGGGGGGSGDQTCLVWIGDVGGGGVGGVVIRLVLCG